MRFTGACAFSLAILLSGFATRGSAEVLGLPSTGAPPPGDSLRIPGLPPVQLPPGTRVFGPNGPVDPESLGPARPRGEAPRTTPRESEAKPEPAKPADPKFKPRPQPREAAQRTKILDE